MLTYKRKLKLTKEQAARIDSWIGACRVVYNMCLEIRIAAYRNKRQSVHKFELMKQITDIRDIPWIADVSIDNLQASVERLDRAYKNFFKNGGFPKFASKKRYKSILFKSCSIVENKIKLPKIGELRMYKDAEINGKTKTATIIKEPTGYFVSITTDAIKDIRSKDESQVIGLDMGIAHFCIDSNGAFIENPQHFKKYERRLRIENKSLARKKRGSNSWKSQAKKLAKLHHKIGNVRRDFLHKESTKIAKINSIVFVEDLNVRGMAKNRSLSKHILDCGWGMFRTMLEYKTNVVVINPKFTSQTCNDCGAKDAKSRISQSKFVCTNCGTESNADVNAAKNILSQGMAFCRQREAVACA